MDWQRARTEEQKDHRRREIMEAGASLFAEQGYELVSLNGIAKRAGMAKANLYRYFESKEEIFLHLYHEDFTDWLEEVVAGLDRLPKGTDPGSVAKLFARTMSSRVRLASLTATVATVLERNLSAQFLTGFKLSLLPYLERLDVALRRVLPSLSPKDANDLLLTLHALVAGLWPMAHPAPVMREVFSHPRLKGFALDFGDALEKALAAMLRGLFAQKD